MVLAEQGKLAEAEACYRQALRPQPDYAGAYSDLGVALADHGRLTEAVACYQQALCLKPDYAEVHTNLAYAVCFGATLNGVVRVRVAVDVPGRYSAFFPATALGRLKPPGQRQGSGILLFAEQGLGDTLHFIRYAPLVEQTGGTVIVQCRGRCSA